VSPLPLGAARLVVAGTAVVAITYQFAILNAAPGYAKGNFWSFFTIQSNVLAVGLLCLLVLVQPDRRTPLFDAVRGAVVLYIAITGVVFALLLSGHQEQVQTASAWVDFVVHKLMPILVVADWLVEPPPHRLPRWTVAAWLVYPLAWFVYTLARGAIVDWYPYPFVDVSELGYQAVLARAVALGVGFGLAAAALLWIGNRRARR
jgi:hypothetical protein